MQGKDTIYVLYLTGKKCQLITDHHQAYSRGGQCRFWEGGVGGDSGMAGFCSSCERGHACCQNSLHGSRPKDSDTRWSDSKACMHVSVLQALHCQPYHLLQSFLATKPTCRILLPYDGFSPVSAYTVQFSGRT
jgi:hypothetical protein